MKSVIKCPHCGLAIKVSPFQNRRRRHGSISYRLVSQKIAFDAQEIRQLVWEVPLSQVARLYGVSQKALEKHCKALGIHMPSRSHWIELEPGQSSREEQQ